MPKKFIQRKDLKKNVEGQAIVKYFVPSEIKAHDDTDQESRTLTFIISTAGVDRDNDTIEVLGWETSNFMKNPVVLFGHNSRELPIGKASNLLFESDKFISDATFMHPDLSKFSDTVYRMLKEKFLNAVSVGFDPLEFVFNEERGGFGADFKKQELLEFSVVPVPSNPEALVIARSAGIDTKPFIAWAEKILDDSKTTFWLPKASLEAIRKSADSTGAVHVFIQQKDSNEGMLFDLNGNVLQKQIKLPVKPTEAELAQLKASAAYVDPNQNDTVEGYKLLHHDGDKVDFNLVKDAMESLLGAGSNDIPASEHEKIYLHLVEHYKAEGIEAPEFKFIKARVLEHMPDDYEFDKASGTIKGKAETQISNPSKGVTKQDIIQLTTEAVRAAVLTATGKLD